MISFFKKKVLGLRKNVMKKPDLHAEVMRSVKQFRKRTSIPGLSQDNRYNNLRVYRYLTTIRNVLVRTRTSAQVRKYFVKVLFGVLVAVFLSGVFLASGGREKSANLLAQIELFHLKNIDIQGCKVTDKNQIRRRAGVDYGTSLLTIDKERMEEIVAADPWVFSAKIMLRWPDEMVIAVKEHAPEALIALGEGDEQKLYYISKYGMPFGEITADDELDFPIITGIQSYQELESNMELKNDIFSFLKQIRRNDPRLPAQDVSEIHVTTDNELVIYLVDQPFPIYMGTGNMKNKYRKLLNILGVLYKKHRKGTKIGDVASIQMNYYGDNKALVSLDD